MQLGKLLRTAFLADYFVNAGFRRELRRVLNRGEAVNALKRAIYIGRVAPTRLEGINLRGVFSFPLERFAEQLLPSQTAAKTSASG